MLTMSYCIYNKIRRVTVGATHRRIFSQRTNTNKKHGLLIPTLTKSFWLKKLSHSTDTQKTKWMRQNYPRAHFKKLTGNVGACMWWDSLNRLRNRACCCPRIIGTTPCTCGTLHTMLVGVITRTGRAWITCINYFGLIGSSNTFPTCANTNLRKLSFVTNENKNRICRIPTVP